MMSVQFLKALRRVPGFKFATVYVDDRADEGYWTLSLRWRQHQQSEVVVLRFTEEQSADELILFYELAKRMLPKLPAHELTIRGAVQSLSHFRAWMEQP